MRYANEDTIEIDRTRDDVGTVCVHFSRDQIPRDFEFTAKSGAVFDISAQQYKGGSPLADWVPCDLVNTRQLISDALCNAPRINTYQRPQLGMLPASLIG